MSYQIEFVPSAATALRGIPDKLRAQLEKKIDQLAVNPRPPGCEKLSGLEGLYRIRSGDYRAVYQIQDKKLLVLIVKIGHRKEIYR